MNENTEYLKNETTDLQINFEKNYVNIKSATEMTLIGNLPLSNLNRSKWKYKDSADKVHILNNEKFTGRKLR